MITENRQRYNERLARARSGKMSTTTAPKEHKNEVLPSTLKDAPKDVPKPITDSVTVFGDLESGGVVVNNNVTEEDIHLQVHDMNEKNLRVVDRRGPCNRFERGICSIGKKFGVKVVFEYQ